MAADRPIETEQSTETADTPTQETFFDELYDFNVDSTPSTGDEPGEEGGSGAADSSDETIEFTNPFDTEESDDGTEYDDINELLQNLSVQDVAGDILKEASQKGDSQTAARDGADGNAEGGAEALEAEAEKPVKLDKLKFDQSGVDKAFQLAKEHNLPVAVYTGATWCPGCTDAGPRFDQIASDMKGADKTPAIMVKLDVDDTRKLLGENSERSKILKELLGDADRIPNVAVYNPNDYSSPVSDNTVPGWSQQRMADEISSAGEKITGEKAEIPEGGSSEPQEEAPTDFNEKNVQQAAEQARSKGLPLISFVEHDRSPDANVAKTFQYLNEQGLAVGVNISAPEGDQLRARGLSNPHYYSLKGTTESASGNRPDGNYFNAVSPDNIGTDMRFNSQDTSTGSDPDQVVDFLKKNGVDLSGSNHEDAVRALLAGKPIPKPEEQKASDETADGADAQGDKAEDRVFKVKTADEALKVIEQAKAGDLPLVVHADTVICSDNSCTMKGLDPSISEGLKDQAMFLEIPRGGFKPEEVGDSKELQALNELFKVSQDDHKTEVDLHAFSFDRSSGEMQRRASLLSRQQGEMRYVSDLIRKK